MESSSDEEEENDPQEIEQEDEDFQARLRGEFSVGDWCQIVGMTLDDTRHLNGTVVRLDHFDYKAVKWCFVIESQDAGGLHVVRKLPPRHLELVKANWYHDDPMMKHPLWTLTEVYDVPEVVAKRGYLAGRDTVGTFT